MRVLNPEFVARYPNRVINIHHSFLPAFIGAKPYQQAYERGVKIIGATAHFINNELDQGPIIMQNVINVDHTYSADAMMRAGRDVEKTVLSRALDLALHDSYFVYKTKRWSCNEAITLEPISRIEGEINLPGSKSLSNRALFISRIS